MQVKIHTSTQKTQRNKMFLAYNIIVKAMEEGYKNVAIVSKMCASVVLIVVNFI